MPVSFHKAFSWVSSLYRIFRLILPSSISRTSPRQLNFLCFKRMDILVFPYHICCEFCKDDPSSLYRLLSADRRSYLSRTFTCSWHHFSPFGKVAVCLLLSFFISEIGVVLCLLKKALIEILLFKTQMIKLLVQPIQGSAYLQDVGDNNSPKLSRMPRSIFRSLIRFYLWYPSTHTQVFFYISSLNMTREGSVFQYLLPRYVSMKFQLSFLIVCSSSLSLAIWF